MAAVAGAGAGWDEAKLRLRDECGRRRVARNEDDLPSWRRRPPGSQLPLISSQPRVTHSRLAHAPSQATPVTSVELPASHASFLDATSALHKQFPARSFSPLRARMPAFPQPCHGALMRLTKKCHGNGNVLATRRH